MINKKDINKQGSNCEEKLNEGTKCSWGGETVQVVWSGKAFLSRWDLNRDLNEEMDTSQDGILGKHFMQRKL